MVRGDWYYSPIRKSQAAKLDVIMQEYNWKYGISNRPDFIRYIVSDFILRHEVEFRSSSKEDSIALDAKHAHGMFETLAQVLTQKANEGDETAIGLLLESAKSSRNDNRKAIR